ncbi:MAG: hypothetical protein ACYDC6_09605 [Acidobacteriaceae bacterium]
MTQKTPSDWYLLAHSMDSFRDEAVRFHHDVHVLLLWTLDAARKTIDAEFERENADIAAAIQQTTGEHQEWLVSRQIELMAECGDQERFLRNIALVGLASLLNHTLCQMARHAELFSRRKKRYKNPSLGRTPSDFERLFIEFADRFRFDLQRDHIPLIAFIKSLNDVRNQIVHDGGLANPPKNWQDVLSVPLQSSAPIGDDTFLNLNFSQNYPEFVSGEGASAEVSVGQEQLESMIDNAKKLVDFCADKIREQQLIHAGAEERSLRGEIQ